MSLERSVLARCGAFADASGCACVYRRAARLFSYQQLDGLGRAWASQKALAVFAGLLGTCEPRRPGARL
jgi:hypothetical protein